MIEKGKLAFEEVCRSFAQWIVGQKRLHRPSSLYIVGVNGTIGQGKTFFSQAVVQQLEPLLKSEEGQPVARSLDDYYLPKEDRYRKDFLARGYPPEEIPNRGPAGTHDVRRLWQDIQKMESGVVPLDFPVFDKQTDDRSPEPYRVEQKVGVFILDGWFVGAKTDADPMKADPGLKRSVASALRDYKPIFDRLDALWAFEPPKSIDEIITQRLEQQETLNRTTGQTGLSPDQIRRFIQYFYQDAWQAGATSPVPPKQAATFWAVTDSQHHFLKVTPDIL